MKRFWLILLALGLSTIFSTPVFAVDVKFSGEYYAAGMYVDKTKLIKDTSADGPSTAFYFQRLRVKADFIVHPGLTLVTRFDAMERIWGGTRSASGTSLDVDSAGTRSENENIVFDWAYIDYKSRIGIFDVGLMNDGSCGTIFGNSSVPHFRIKYAYFIGPVKIALDYTKVKEKSHTAVAPSTFTDVDNDKYGIEGVYTWKGGKAGVKVNYYRYAENKPVDDSKKVYFLFTPYAIAKIGPVALQAEISYAYGKYKDYESPSVLEDVKMREWRGWIDATATFGFVYFGGTFAYVSGDDPSTTKREGGDIDGGRDWNPCLILFGYYDTYRWVGAIRGWDNTATGDVNNAMKNAFFYQGRIGVRPISDLDIMASLSYAEVDEKPSGYVDSDYGLELDLTASYKITNNLSYMLGFGYLWTGDYFKYNDSANEIDDNFMVINKLTLTF